MRTDFEFKDNAPYAVLHHKKNRQRSLPVKVVLDSSVLAPHSVAGSWAVPCEVIGLESKKTKVVKIRFHPSLPELCQSDKSVAHIALKEAEQYLSTLLMHSEWSLAETTDQRPKMLRRISNFLLQQEAFLSVSRKCIVLNWPFYVMSKSGGGGNKKLEDCLEDAQRLLQSPTISNGLEMKIENCGTDANGTEVQLVEFCFTKPDLTIPLLKLHLGGGLLKTGLFRDSFKLTSFGLRFSLDRRSNEEDLSCLDCPAPLPLIKKYVVIRDKQEQEKMLDASQLRVGELRRRLDESLAAFQKSAGQKDRKARSLHIVRVNETEAMIEIGEHSSRPCLDRLLASSSPLNVICDGTQSMDLATSPAESTDSGVSLSSPVYSAKQSPFYQYSEENRLGMRQRSQSESDWSTGGLKGILKKPSGGSGRSRFLSRSVSESHHDPNGDQFCLMRSTTLEEEEEEGEEMIGEEGGVSGRKKRVSFSEKLVQLRRFKSGQCILAQAKKNEKKRQQKKRKEEERRRMSESHSEVEDEKENEKAGLRSTRQDSGFVDGEDDEEGVEKEREEKMMACGDGAEKERDGKMMSSSPEQGWKQLIKHQRQVGAL